MYKYIFVIQVLDLNINKNHFSSKTYDYGIQWFLEEILENIWKYR